MMFMERVPVLYESDERFDFVIVPAVSICMLLVKTIGVCQYPIVPVISGSWYLAPRYNIIGNVTHCILEFYTGLSVFL